MTFARNIARNIARAIGELFSAINVVPTPRAGLHVWRDWLLGRRP